jgi:DNA modification methylase
VKPYYEDAACTIYHGDCREVLPLLSSVDHVITDPPYEAEAHTKARRIFDGTSPGKPVDTWVGSDRIERVEALPFAAMDDETRETTSREMARLARRWVLVFCQAEAAHLWEFALVNGGLNKKRWCVWVKPDAQPQFTGDRPGVGYETIVACHAAGRSSWNGGGRVGVFTHVKNVTGSRFKAPHPTTKPDALMAELIALFTDPGDVVLDPFAGSGSTGVSAKRLGRRCILIEREEKYCAIAAKRLAQGALDLFGEQSA